MCLPFRKTKTQNIRVCSKERFIDWESINWEDGNLIFKSILRKHRVQASFIWREVIIVGQEVIDHVRKLSTSRSPKKMVLADVSPVMRFLLIFDKHIFPLSPLEGTLWQSSCFCKPQAPSRIHSMFKMSIWKTKQKLLARGHGNKAGLNKMESESWNISLCYKMITANLCS